MVYLDLDVEVGLARKRSDQAVGRGEWNRMDEQTLAFHQRVRQGYLTMAAEAPERWLTIDGSLSIEAIHRAILARVDAVLNSDAVSRTGVARGTQKKGDVRGHG